MEDDEDEWTFPWIEGDSLAPPCQSEYKVVDEVLKHVKIDSSDVVYDLGCGDGRICIRAAEKYKSKAIGIEIEPVLVEKGRDKIQQMNLQHLVEIIQGDLLQQDFFNATVIVTYLLPEAMELLAPVLIKALKRGVRVICNTWGLPRHIHWPRVESIDLYPTSNTTLLLYLPTDVEE